MKKSIYLLLILLTILLSCEKEVELDLPQMEETIAVEGWIETGYPAYVLITRTTPYFTVIDSTSIIKQFVFNAKVIVSDGTVSEELKLPPNFTPNVGYFPFLAYQGQNIKGEVGKTYYLTIEHEGKRYTSSTTIPHPVPYDKYWFKLDSARAKDSLGIVWFNFTDPANEENFYRIYSMRINKDRYYIPTFPSTFEDKYFNGKSFTFNVFRGRQNYMTEVPEEEKGKWRFFKLGDTIVFRTCAIDKATYKFWRAAEQEMSSGGNPFSNPRPIPTNIKEEQGRQVFGIWAGYGSLYDTIIAIE